jgi:ribosomal protein L11 methyltransferase
MRSKPVYLKAVFETPGGLADEAAGILMANGALGCAVLRGGRAGSRSRRPVKLEAYFAKLKPIELRAIRRTMRAAGMLTDSDRDAGAQSIIDPGWATMWQKRFEPTSIGERFLIVPPWHRASETGRISIVVKPGQAFGTGHHPTTAGALIAIDEISARHKIARALDVGAGSGILAMAMAMLGIPKIVAIDNDPLTLDNARENAKLNRVTTRIAFSTTPVAKMKATFDLIVANILSSTLIEVAPDLKRILAPEGHLILGGILAKEAAKVIDCYGLELRLIDKRIIKGWATLIFAKRGRGR